MSALDRSALQQGAFVSLVFAVPFAIASSLVASAEGNSPWAAVLWLGALAGFTLGAGVAAWVQQRGFPLLHGLLCAGGTYLVTQSLASVIRVLRDKPVSWLAIFFTFSIVLFAGVIGGLLGGQLRRRGIVPGALKKASDELAAERDR